MNVTITRKSRNIGFGYSTNVVNHEKGWRIEKPTAPNFTGTVRTVKQQIENDPTFNLVKKCGTFHNARWFVKVDGKWMAVEPDQYWHPLHLVGDYY